MAAVPKPVMDALCWLHTDTEVMNLMLGMLSGKLAECTAQLGSKGEGLARAGRMVGSIGPLGAVSEKEVTIVTSAMISTSITTSPTATSTATSTAASSGTIKAIVKVLQVLGKALDLAADVEAQPEEAVTLKRVALVVVALAGSLQDADWKGKNFQALQLAIVIKTLSGLQEALELPAVEAGGGVEGMGENVNALPKVLMIIDFCLGTLEYLTQFLALCLKYKMREAESEYCNIIVMVIGLIREIFKIWDTPKKVKTDFSHV